jgi:flagellar biosynthesis protein FliQ
MTLPDWYGVGALKAFLALAAPPLAVCLLLGIAGAMLQTMTQIRDSAIAFVPKVFGLLLVIALGGGLMLHVTGQYAQSVFTSLPTLVHDVRDSK